MNSRIRRVDNQKEFERVVDDFITTGYKVVSRGNSSARLVKYGKKDKHLLVFLLTGWWTLGIGNIVYACLPSPAEDEVLVKIEG